MVGRFGNLLQRSHYLLFEVEDLIVDEQQRVVDRILDVSILHIEGVSLGEDHEHLLVIAIPFIPICLLAVNKPRSFMLPIQAQLPFHLLIHQLLGFSLLLAAAILLSFELTFIANVFLGSCLLLKVDAHQVELPMTIATHLTLWLLRVLLTERALFLLFLQLFLNGVVSGLRLRTVLAGLRPCGVWRGLIVGDG